MKNIGWSISLLFLCTIISCNGQKVVSQNTQETCETKGGYGYNNKCWEGFDDEGIAKNDKDSVVTVQMKLLKEATDFPTNSPEYLPYIQYYESIGFTNQWSRDFYFYTINAASAANIHWMTEAEIQ